MNIMRVVWQTVGRITNEILGDGESVKILQIILIKNAGCDTRDWKRRTSPEVDPVPPEYDSRARRA